MGGKNQTTQTTQSTRAPWEAAQPQLNTILGQVGGIDPSLTGNQTDALNQTVALARAGNPYAPAIDSYTTTMLSGGGPDRSGLVNDAYSRYQRDLEGTARGDYLDPNKNPFFAQTTQTISDDIQNRVNGMFAGAGRDLSGANQGTLARGISEGLAPVYGSIYNTERGNQLNAQGALYNAGNTTGGILSNMDQMRLGNMGAGVQSAYASNEAQYDPYNRILSAEAARQGIPLSVLQQMAGVTTPIASLGGTMDGTTTTQQPSQLLPALLGAGIAGAGMFASPYSPFKGMFGAVQPTQAAAGAGFGAGAGLFGR
jgi:hypothetical protein